LGNCAADTGPPRLRSGYLLESAALGGKRHVRFTHERERCCGTNDERSPPLMSGSRRCLAYAGIGNVGLRLRLADRASGVFIDLQDRGTIRQSTTANLELSGRVEAKEISLLRNGAASRRQRSSLPLSLSLSLGNIPIGVQRARQRQSSKKITGATLGGRARKVARGKNAAGRGREAETEDIRESSSRASGSPAGQATVRRTG